ncbi:MAG: zinc ABC transporter substrate-binding protein [Armatimonadota bacterium]|nr:zinc ABC transporter substrate-binding protein [Armatimonadota bacterium]
MKAASGEMRRWSGVAAVLGMTLLGLSCREAPEEGGPGPSPQTALSAFVSIPPQAYLVERVGGRHVQVNVLVGPGQSPATYEPSPSQMSGLDEADVYFRIGVPFEEALVPRIRASMPDLPIVDTRQGIEMRPMVGGDDAHAGEARRDPHTWLDPDLAKMQARTICENLQELDPEHADQYQRNLEGLLADLEAVDEEIARALEPFRGAEILVFHPAYGYFADAYGLKQVAIELEGKRPTPRQLEAIIEEAECRDIRAIFVQPQFSTASAEAIAREIGAVVVPLDPLARDYLSNLRQMAQRIRSALE